MAFGFKTISTTGDVTQIDQDYKNFALKEKATVTTDTNLSFESGKESSYKNVTFSNSFTYPVIALYSTTPVFMIAQTTTGCSIVAKGAAGQSVTYYVFDQPPTTPPSTGFGMKVMLSNGETAYTDSLKYMRVLNQMSIAPAAWDGSAGGHGVATLATGPGRTLAAVQCQPGVRMRATGSGGGMGSTPGECAGGGTFYGSGSLQIYSMFIFGFNTSEGYDSGGTYGTWLAIDVTGY